MRKLTKRVVAIGTTGTVVTLVGTHLDALAAVGHSLASQPLSTNVAWVNGLAIFGAVNAGLVVSGFYVGLRRYTRSVRIQTLKATLDSVQRYNDKIRGPMNAFLKDFNSTFDTMKAMIEPNPVNMEAWIVQGELMIAKRLGLADVLHLLDELALTFEQDEYLHQDELAHAITSEVSRVLLHPNLQNAITQLLNHSSLQHVGKLQAVLRKDENHGRYV